MNPSLVQSLRAEPTWCFWIRAEFQVFLALHSLLLTVTYSQLFFWCVFLLFIICFDLPSRSRGRCSIGNWFGVVLCFFGIDFRTGAELGVDLGLGKG